MTEPYTGCPVHGLECEWFAVPVSQVAFWRRQAVEQSTTLVLVDPTERSTPDAAPHA
jgi:hypothetical protein